MVAFDTNVLVRVLVGDDPVQTRKAERAFARHASADGVFLSLVVLAETAWVLAAAYRWNRATIHERLSRVTMTRGVVIERIELVRAALEGFAKGTADFADYVILGRAREEGTVLLTFDRRLARTGGTAAP